MIFYRVRRWMDHSWSTLCCGVQVIRLQCVQPVYVGCIIVAGTCYGSVLPVYNVPPVRSLHRYCRHSDTVLRICIYQWRLRSSQFDHNWLYSSHSIVRLKSFGAQPRNGWTEPPHPPPHPFKLWVNSTFQKVTYTSVIKWLYLLIHLHRVLILYVGLKFIVWSLMSALTIVILLKAKHSITASVLWFVSPEMLCGWFLNFWNVDDHPVNT